MDAVKFDERVFKITKSRNPRTLASSLPPGMCGLVCAVLWRGLCGLLLALIALPGMLLAAIPGIFVVSCADCRRKENAKLSHKIKGRY